MSNGTVSKEVGTEKLVVPQENYEFDFYGPATDEPIRVPVREDNVISVAPRAEKT